MIFLHLITKIELDNYVGANIHCANVWAVILKVV